VLDVDHRNGKGGRLRADEQLLLMAEVASAGIETFGFVHPLLGPPLSGRACRDRDRDLEPSAGSRAGGDRGAVGAGDRVGDGEAEPDALGGVETLLGAGEGLE
jgi:hypothetical protein